jgi:hypothetical protein
MAFRIKVTNSANSAALRPLRINGIAASNKPPATEGKCAIPIIMYLLVQQMPWLVEQNLQLLPLGISFSSLLTPSSSAGGTGCACAASPIFFLIEGVVQSHAWCSFVLS